MAVDAQNKQSNAVIRQHAKLLEDFGYILGEQRVNNLSPVVQKQITQHNGIEITGSFSTSDSSDRGEMSYVTVLRNPDQAIPHDGLGFAWRKGDGSTYNVYLTDNDALTDTFQVLQNETLIGDGSINSFMVAGKRIISASSDTYYDFKLRITAEMGMKLWIVTQGTEMTDDPYDIADVEDGGYLMERGSQSTDYAPSAGSAYSRDDWSLLDFGISVGRTQNSLWYYGDIKIVAISDTYPIALYRLDASTDNFIDGQPFYINWKGWGTWGAQGDGDYGAKIHIWNYNSSLWEDVGEHTASGTSTNALKTIEKQFLDITNYRSSPNYYVNLLARPLQADEAAELYTDYVYMNNVLASGIHTGNMTDIYINDPNNIEEATVTISDSGDGVINLSPGSAHAAEVTFPIAEIVSISVLDNILVPGVDYTITQNNPELAYSTRTNMTINKSVDHHSSGAVITYRYYSNGESVQDLLNGNTFRAPGVDNLAKINPPTVISIDTLEYRGGLAEENMKTALATWINGRTVSLEISDMVNFLYTKNVNYVNLTNLDVRVDSYNYQAEQDQDGVQITSTHTLSGLGAYFAHVNDLTLTKLS